MGYFDDEEEPIEGQIAPDPGLNPAPQFNPRVKEYLEGLRAAQAQAADAQSSALSRIGSGVGAAIAGRDPTGGINAIRENDARIQRDVVGNFEKREAAQTQAELNREKIRSYLEQKKLSASAKAETDAKRSEERDLDRDLRRDTARSRHDEAVARAAEARDRKDQRASELSSTQAKQLGLYQSGVAANDQYERAIANPKEYNPTEQFQPIDNSDSEILKPFRNKKAIESQAAQSAWVESFLRDASGAAIPPAERLSYAKDFFPNAGDTPEVVANKKVLREQKMENARVAAGGNLERKEVAKHDPRASRVPSPSSDGMVAVQAPNGRVKRIPENEVEAALAAGGVRVNPVAGGPRNAANGG